MVPYSYQVFLLHVPVVYWAKQPSESARTRPLLWAPPRHPTTPGPGARGRYLNTIPLPPHQWADIPPDTPADLPDEQIPAGDCHSWVSSGYCDTPEMRDILCAAARPSPTLSHPASLVARVLGARRLHSCATSCAAAADRHWWKAWMPYQLPAGVKKLNFCISSSHSAKCGFNVFAHVSIITWIAILSVLLRALQPQITAAWDNGLGPKVQRLGTWLGLRPASCLYYGSPKQQCRSLV